MKRAFLFSCIILSGSFILLQCKNPTSSDSGGSGADFDANLYYTKSEIDSKLTALGADLGHQLKYAAEEPQAVTGLGYQYGAGSFNIPTGYSSVIFQIIATNSDTNSKTINVHFADGTNAWGNGVNWSTKIVIPASSSIQVPGIVDINSKTGPVKAWLDSSTSSPWDSTYTVSVAPLFWIK